MGFDLSQKKLSIIKDQSDQYSTRNSAIVGNNRKEQKKKIYKADAVETKMNKYLMTKVCVF